MIATQKQPPLPGTRPEGTRDEREAAVRVREMFTRIAPRYDVLNRVISFRLDQVWRRRAAKKFLRVLQRPDARVLDLCCGTGDLAFALARVRARAPGGAQNEHAKIIGSDFVEPMLVRGREKALAGHGAVVFAAGDALRLPFPDASFDLVTAAFGFRNLVNYEGGLREFARVLKPGGELGILEFSDPTSGPMAKLFLVYFRHILPRIGETFTKKSGAYDYLPRSVSKFPSIAELSALIEKCGFRDVHVAPWLFGSVVLHTAVRA